MKIGLRIATVLAAAAIIPLLMAPSGGFPSRPNFQAIGVNRTPSAVQGSLTEAGANPLLQMCETDAAANNQCWRMIANATAFDLQACDDTFSSCGTAGLHFTRSANVITDLTVNGVSILPSQGTFTATWDDACTTSPTSVFDWSKVGNIVTLTMRSTSGFPCTSDSVSFAATSTATVPAAIRPVTNTRVGRMSGFVNNGVATEAQIFVPNDGTIQIEQIPSFGAAITNWTAAGNKSALSFTTGTVTYMTVDP